MVLPVKVLLPGNNLLVHTLDISYTGARIGAIRGELSLGQIVSLSRGTQRAQFRIVWVQQVGGHEFHAGLEAIRPEHKFWGVDLDAKECNEGDELLLRALKSSTKG